MICNSLHSSAQGEAATRGGRTNLDGAGVSPDCSISFTPRGNCPDVSTTALRRSNVARLHTNSFVSSTKTRESLGPSLENKTMGGSSETALKNEYGARLISPLALIEVIQPMGRGATMAFKGLCGSPWSFFAVS